jgi:hypothetical protein
MDPFQYQELENLKDLFYNAPDEKVTKIQTRKLSEGKLFSFFDSPENFQSILILSLRSTSPELQFLSLKSIKTHLSQKWKSLSISDQSSLFKEFFNSIFLTTSVTPNYTLIGKCKILANICRLGWNQFIQSAALLEQVTTLAYNDRSKLLPSLFLFQELINEMSQPTKYRSLPVKRKFVTNFQENMLGGIFLFLVELLRSFLSLQENELENLMDLAISVLSFGFDVVLDEGCEIESRISNMWKVMYEEILKFIDKVLFSVTCSDVIETKAVVLLGCLGKVKNLMLSGQISNFIDSYLKISFNIFRLKTFTGDKLTEFVKGVKMFIETFEVQSVGKSPYFNEWIQSLHEFSLRLFQSSDAIYSQYNSSMIIWNLISNEANSIQSQSISLIISSLFKPFIASTLSNSSPSLLLDNLEPLKDHLDLISSFSLYFSSEFLQILLEFFSFVLETWSKSRTSESESQLAWLLFLSSSFLTYKATKSSIDQNSFILQQVLYIIQNLDPSEVCLAVASTNYLTIYSKLWVNVAEDNFGDSSEDNDSSESPLKVLDKIVLFIFKEMQFNSHPVVINWVLDLFEYLAKGHYSAKVLMQVNTIQDFSYNFLNYPLCLHDSKLRAKVFHVLASLWMHEQNTEGLDSLLAPYELAFNRNEQRQPQYFEFLFREIQGICSAINTQSHFFTWFIDRAEFFVGVCQEFFLEDRTFTAFLKMMQEITDVRGNRIVFNENSAYGVIMFKKIAPLITRYSQFLANKNREISNFLGKSKRIVGIMKNFLIGGYVCFGVFQVFNDSTFLDSINATFTLISKLSYSEITVFLNRFTQNF